MVSDLFNEQPELLAILIAISGFLLARLLSGLVDRWLMSLEGYLRRRAPSRLDKLDLRALRGIAQGAVYYGTLVLFLLAALQTLRISVVKEWLGLLLQYVPQLLLGGLIILSGYLLGLVVRSLLAGLMSVGTDHLVPRFAQLIVVTAAILTGLAQTAIDISFISNVMVILLAFFFGGLSLAFALGSRQLVENLLARRSLDRYRIGDNIRIDGSQGKIVEILSTAVVIESGKGLVTIPTARFMDSEVLLVKEDSESESSAAG
ncbi:mechanosensitive ion channel [Seongchinamella unica]|uniref:Mechanosensitive ion channel n=1 Tax=Seongchinamella unica TaxID=2547392 RepID=A0A4R5LWH9_9GAMM|nr:mechanosensitive ion channel domain-containing protein [Seongchinamella unica]TDG15777.1 mechanosensitive ion channel [Seongchinamella unica]